MTEQIEITDPEVVRMAQELAQRYDGDLAAAVHAALREALAKQEIERARKRREIHALAARIQEHLPPEAKGLTSKEMMDSLYDEDGLPA